MKLEKRFKCHACHEIIEESKILKRNGSNLCPICEQPIAEMCPVDHCHCTCALPVHHVVEYCPICKSAICPGCGTHDVLQISRVTGYLQDVSGFNAGKQQELKDRKRYCIT